MITYHIMCATKQTSNNPIVFTHCATNSVDLFWLTTRVRQPCTKEYGLDNPTDQQEEDAHGCHRMSKRLPPSGRYSPASGLWSTLLSCAASPAGTAADFLHLLKVDDREVANDQLSFTFLNALSTVSSLSSPPVLQGMTCQQVAAAQGPCLFPLLSMPLRTGGGALL